VVDTNPSSRGKSAKNPLYSLPIGFPHCEMLGCLFGLCCGASCHSPTPAPHARIGYVAPHHITTLPLWLLCIAPMLHRTNLPTCLNGVMLHCTNVAPHQFAMLQCNIAFHIAKSDLIMRKGGQIILRCTIFQTPTRSSEAPCQTSSLYNFLFFHN
jgi:hypothetical protein